MKKLLSIILIAFSLLMQSCDKFLEENPQSQITPDNFYKTPTDAITAVNAVYVAALKNEVISVEYLWLNEMAADDAFYTGTAVVDRDAMNLLSFNDKNSYILAVWANRYRAINRANEVLIYVHPTNAGNVSNRVQAEARFMRAFCYFDLVRWFGDVPLFTGFGSADPYPKRAPIKDVYTQIIEDLKFAETNLDDKYSYMDVNGGRATKGAAKALLGRVYLTMAGAPLKETGMFAEAEKKLKEVIDNKTIYGYEFMASYSNIFPKSPNDNNKGTNSEAIFYTRSTAGLSAVAGSWSFHRISQWILSYGMKASADIIASQDTFATAVYKTTDLRRKNNLGKTKGAYPTVANNPYTIVDIDVTGTATTGTAVNTVKFIDIINGNNAACDYQWLRYTDVLLMYAEALIEQNKSLDIAMGYINMTRNRAGIGNFAGAQNQAELRAELRAERRREFLFEGTRRNDLIRWGILAEAVKASKTRSFLCYKKVAIGDISYIDNSTKYTLFPIPNNELVTNPNMTPNP
jgi:hypothetical protein